MKLMEQLKKRSAELADLHHIMALLQWDQEVMLPREAADERADQVATLSTIIHQKEVDGETGRLLAALEGDPGRLTEADRALVRVMRRSYDQAVKLPERFVAEFAALTSRALPVWVEARQQNDFDRFRPLLERIVAMSREQADYLGFAEEPYDALLDLYEEGLTTAQATAIFSAIRAPLSELLGQARARQGEELAIAPPMEPERQAALAEKLLAIIGYDFDRGRQDRSAHPFTTDLGHHDRRITNRYQPRSIEFIFSALHEGGHALYEMGIAPELARSALDSGVSLGIHESQSRLWENIIGRSLPFWQHCYPLLREAFPEQFGRLPVARFVAAANLVRPGPIRVEADEVSYNLHVLIRFELEKGLIEGDVTVADLPALWNEKYRDYLGVEVKNDAEGVLQDIHWAHGSLGYFPTYTIGNLAAAQFWAAYRRHDPAAEQTVAAGDFGRIRGWLTEAIYRHGSILPPETLIEAVTGEPLNPRYLLDYLAAKYG